MTIACQEHHPAPVPTSVIVVLHFRLMHCVMATPGRRERVHYHHESGTEEILSPTLITVGGRCYRKLTEITFGRKKGVESLEDRTKKPIFTGQWHQSFSGLVVVCCLIKLTSLISENGA